MKKITFFVIAFVLLAASLADAKIIFRWNGTDLSQFDTRTTGGTLSVSGGKIVLAGKVGNYNKDSLGFWLPDVIIGNRPGMSVEFLWQINDLGPGDGFSPSQFFILSNNTDESGSPTPFPDWRVGLGFWLDYSIDPDHFGTLRDTTHNPAVYSGVTLSVDTDYRLKQSIASDGKNTLSVNGTSFTTALGPTTSGGNYAGIAYAGDATKNGDFNNTTNPLTVNDAQTSYTISRPFADTGWQLNKYYSLTDAGGNHVEAIQVTAINGNHVTFARGQLGTTVTAFPNGRGIYTIPELRFYWQNHGGSITTKIDDIHITDDGSYIPTAPSNLSGTAASGTSVLLTWTDGADSVEADSISVEVNGVEYENVDIGDGQVLIAGLTPQTSYDFDIRSKVTAFGTEYFSDYAGEITVTTPAASQVKLNRKIGINYSRTGAM